MKRPGAVLLLGLIILGMLYAVELISIRRQLNRESVGISSRLRYIQAGQVNTAQIYFESNHLSETKVESTKFMQSHPGMIPTYYSELGLPKDSKFPPVSETLRPEKINGLKSGFTWIETRWIAQDGKLWLENLGSKENWPPKPNLKAFPIFGLAIPIPKEVLLPNESRFDLSWVSISPSRIHRLTAKQILLPGGDASVVVILHRKIGFWTHLAFLLLTWILVVGFLRFLKSKPLQSGEREMQLEEELAYLSKTYQNLSKSLRMERQKVEAIFNSAPDGIFTCTPEGTITFWNRSMETITKVPKEMAVGKHYRESMNIFASGGQILVDPFSLNLSQDKNLNLLDCKIEAIRSQEPGEESNPILPVALGAAPVTLADGTVEEMVVTVKDIRAQKEAEQLRKDMQAMITHDLRSPLSAILGYAGLIQNSKTCKSEADAQKYLEAIVRAGKEMLILIGNLLGWSWIEEGRLNFQKESLAIAPILNETVESLGILAKPKNLSIVVGAPNDFWALTDGDKLKEVLNNLITNAIKFSRPGGMINVSASAEDDKIRISVADQGPGIPPEEREKLFQKFSTLRAPGSGTGLGLYIVKTITKALDGTVEVESEVGKGSTFSILIPAFQKVPAHPQQLSLMSLVGADKGNTK